VFFVNRRAQMMIELVQNNERVSHYVAVEHRYGRVFGRVTARSLRPATFRQAYFQFRRAYLVVLREEVNGFFRLSIENEPND